MKMTKVPIVLTFALTFLRTTFLVFLALVFVGCGPADNPLEVQLDEQFQLKYGQVATLRDNDLSLKFNAVVEDSRCPIDLACIVAGNAEIVLEILHRKFHINTTSGPREISYAERKIKLVSLSPTRKHNQKIKLQDYTITLLVTIQ